LPAGSGGILAASFFGNSIIVVEKPRLLAHSDHTRQP
jgi:hypothetical protein